MKYEFYCMIYLCALNGDLIMRYVSDFLYYLVQVFYNIY